MQWQKRQLSQRCIVLTGAGISAESGIKTFRDHNGLWENHRIEDVATPEAFSRNPALVQQFYNLRRAQLLSPAVQPNAAHLALAEFEKNFAGEFLLVTQNVDNLHERAGSQNLRHMHGELLKARCNHCAGIVPWLADIELLSPCPRCHRSGGLRPHIVWFGEMPLYMQEIYDALRQCDLFVSIGTSGHVYPAAGFVEQARNAGARTVELNLEPSAGHSFFDESYQGLASILIPEFFARICATQPD